MVCVCLTQIPVVSPRRAEVKLYHAAGGAFSRPNLVFNTAQPQLQISTNPPAAAMPSTLWPQRFPGSGSPPSNLYMPSIPEPHQAPLPAQNGNCLSNNAFLSMLMPAAW